MLLGEEFVDVFDIVERVVYEELEFGNDAQLMAHAVAQFEAHLLCVVVDVGDDFSAALRGEDAEIYAADAHVGRDAHCAYRYEDTGHRLCLLLKNVAKFFLNKSCYFLLACRFHIFLKLRVEVIRL